VTEDEAKKKWCPYARVGAYTDKGQIMAITVNRDPRDEVSEGCLCLGSECMAWRETYAMSRSNPACTPETGHQRSLVGGYCGLAGRP
jgi:hypothetical protein